MNENRLSGEGLEPLRNPFIFRPHAAKVIQEPSEMRRFSGGTY
jgi:hypothetical protein